MTIPVHTKDTLSNVAWATPPTNAITSASSTGPDRFLQTRLSYRRSGGNARSHDPAFHNKARVIIPHSGKSFAAPPL